MLELTLLVLHYIIINSSKLKSNMIVEWYWRIGLLSYCIPKSKIGGPKLNLRVKLLYKRVILEFRECWMLMLNLFNISSL